MKSQVQSQWLVKERMLKEVYNLGLCINWHLQITMNQWKTRTWKKTPILMWLRKLRIITYNHINMKRHGRMCWMKYWNHIHIKGIHSWIKQNTQLNSKVLELLSRIYAFYEEEGHAIMDYPFEPFHTRESIDRHVEL